MGENLEELQATRARKKDRSSLDRHREKHHWLNKNEISIREQFLLFEPSEGNNFSGCLVLEATRTVAFRLTEAKGSLSLYVFVSPAPSLFERNLKKAQTMKRDEDKKALQERDRSDFRFLARAAATYTKEFGKL